MKAIENLLEVLIFNSRWLLAPFYLGLVAGIFMLLVKFTQELFHVIPNLFTSSESEVVLAVLSLVDLSLVANLLLIVIFSGYENFVSRIGTAGHEDWPEWMSKIDFTGLKLKLLSSIVAISAIQLLRAFMDINKTSDRELMWSVIIHVVFVSSGLLLALTDSLSEHPTKDKGKSDDH
jgi:uncharacterized protein (TIGR00645 family)